MSRRPEGYDDYGGFDRERLVAGFCGAALAGAGLTTTWLSIKFGVEAELMRQSVMPQLEMVADGNRMLAIASGAGGIIATAAGVSLSTAAVRS